MVNSYCSHKFQCISPILLVQRVECLCKIQISGPALIFSFFAGALADRYGCKRFMVFPIIGKLVSDIGMIINYAFIEKVPIELFFIEPVDSFFGGAAVFYLGK